VFITNDPYAGGTHFNDVRVLRPIFANNILIAWAMANGHWSDVGGLVPGSFDVNAREHFGEGLRISSAKVIQAFDEMIRNVRTQLQSRILELPDGTWTATDYLDSDPSQGEGLIPIQVTMTIAGDRLSYDLTGSAPAVSSFMNATFGSTLSGILAGTKHFVPEIPVNAGFYQSIDVNYGPTGTVVNATWPTAVSGFVSGVRESAERDL
ncbi:MAG: hydantoinase B/oxoprolinase family protein, partial [Pontimonas sp.]|nr:hydantoinase B/oxoprolinase family protein [Pontimonas sp.]